MSQIAHDIELLKSPDVLDILLILIHYPLSRKDIPKGKVHLIYNVELDHTSILIVGAIQCVLSQRKSPNCTPKSPEKYICSGLCKKKKIKSNLSFFAQTTTYVFSR
jgi:hypothetical protein